MIGADFRVTYTCASKKKHVLLAFIKPVGVNHSSTSTYVREVVETHPRKAAILGLGRRSTGVVRCHHRWGLMRRVT